MKHGVAFRKFSRTKSHRNLLLRNLVTSLLEHEQIKTTLAKAKDTARLAEKMISLGKRNTQVSKQQARAFCLNDFVVTKLFGALAERYQERSGGYTRVHKFGAREGDNAPSAVLELVDNPQDLRLAMTSRAIGWELVSRQLRDGKASSDPAQAVHSAIYGHGNHGLRPLTVSNLQKVAKYTDSKNKLQQIVDLSVEWMKRLVADPDAHPHLARNIDKKSLSSKDEIKNPYIRQSDEFDSPAAGQRVLDDTEHQDKRRNLGGWSGMKLSKGDLSRPARPRRYVRQRGSVTSPLRT